MSASEPEPAAGAAGRHGLSELIAERRAKAQRLRQSDAGAFPYSFKDAEPVKRVLDASAHLSAGDETDDLHRVAGRIAARRGSGGAAFLDLVDRTGKIQLHARLDVLGKEAFERLSGTRITTNIKANGEEVTDIFGLIEKCRIVRQTESGPAALALVGALFAGSPAAAPVDASTTTTSSTNPPSSPTSTTVAKYITTWLNRHIAPYNAGQCPLHLSALFIRLGGTCAGMMGRGDDTGA